jgi:hypothetical protein
MEIEVIASFVPHKTMLDTLLVKPQKRLRFQDIKSSVSLVHQIYILFWTIS